MEVRNHISKLLYTQDCVIVPDFGGFVTRYAPARIHPTQHILYPPHKQISFNANLKNNDGLLANEIATAEGKSYTDALLILQSFSKESTNTLKANKPLYLQDIGTLRMNMEGAIQFEADTTVNYLASSFGLTPIQSLPIKRVEERKVVEFIDRPPIAQPRIKRRTAVMVATSAAMLLMLTLIILPMQKQFSNYNFSSFNIFGSKTKLTYKERKFVKDACTAQSFYTPTALGSLPDTVSLIAISFLNNDKKLVAKLKDDVSIEVLQPDKTDVAHPTIKNTAGMPYHIVSGCFKLEQNAHNFIAQLSAKGVIASIIGKNKDGLFVVSCGDFSNKNAAYSAMATIRSKNIDAWLYKQ